MMVQLNCFIVWPPVRFSELAEIASVGGRATLGPMILDPVMFLLL